MPFEVLLTADANGDLEALFDYICRRCWSGGSWGLEPTGRITMALPLDDQIRRG